MIPPQNGGLTPLATCSRSPALSIVNEEMLLFSRSWAALGDAYRYRGIANAGNVGKR
jgi:hypothetical protein